MSPREVPLGRKQDAPESEESESESDDCAQAKEGRSRRRRGRRTGRKEWKGERERILSGIGLGKIRV